MENFKKFCDKIVGKLSKEMIKDFINLEDDEARIVYLYELAKSEFVPLKVSSVKNLSFSLKCKTKGNEFYKHKDLKSALLHYNEGIRSCPVDSDDGKELLAFLVSNRSAVFFEEQLYLKSCEDVKYVFNLGSYPKNLSYKLYMRLARCYVLLKRKQDAMQVIMKAKKLLLPNQEEKLKEMEALINELSTCKEEQDQVDLCYNKYLSVNKMYPAACSFVEFDSDQNQGRYAKATCDIDPGTIILQESPHCLIVSKSHLATNCLNCGVSNKNLYPCRRCIEAGFCSMECQNEAFAYHKHECLYIKELYESDLSINCLMALRLITQHNFDFFWKNKTSWNIPKNEVYVNSDYRRVYNLCTNIELRPKEELIVFTIMSLYLLHFLKFMVYFPGETNLDVLTNKESYVGSLILRHIQLLQFNAHEISELRNIPVVNPIEINYEASHVGAALYPTLALFNHSCEPGVIRYNKGCNIVARTIKLIRKGEIIHENYGPIYSSNPKSERQRELRLKYFFNCSCIPCEQNWPLYKDIDENILYFVCLKCGHVNKINKDGEEMAIKCSKCGKFNNLFNILLKLSGLDSLTINAEGEFMKKDFEKACEIYCEALKIYCTHLAPPHPDIIKVQQRLRTCMLFYGNKQAGFTFDKCLKN